MFSFKYNATRLNFYCCICPASGHIRKFVIHAICCWTRQAEVKYWVGTEIGSSLFSCIENGATIKSPINHIFKVYIRITHMRMLKLTHRQRVLRDPITTKKSWKQALQCRANLHFTGIDRSKNSLHIQLKKTWVYSLLIHVIYLDFVDFRTLFFSEAEVQRSLFRARNM